MGRPEPSLSLNGPVDTLSVYALGRPSAPAPQQPNPFSNTQCVTLPAVAGAAGIDVFAPGARHVAAFYDATQDRAIYLLGRALHRRLSGDAMLRWCGESAETDPAALRELMGHFVILIDDRRRGRIRMISDPLGVRPWFFGAVGGRLAAGANVLGLCDAGLTRGQVSYDSIASWLCYNFDCTEGSIAADYRRLPPATIATCDAAGRPLDEHAYAPMQFCDEKLPTDEVTDRLFHAVQQNFAQLVDGHERVQIPLSGGFDSRLLCALALQRDKPRATFVSVASKPKELQVAREVAQALQLPLQVIPRGRSLLDLHEDPLWFRPEGQPTARNLTNAIVNRAPGVPIVSGFAGDAFMRLPVNEAIRQYLALDDQNLDDAGIVDASHWRFMQPTHRMDLLQPRVAGNVQERARAAMLGVVRQGRKSGRPVTALNFLTRVRLYFAGIFLSHLEKADALLPFYSWDLIELRTRYHRSFSGEMYPNLFRRHVPAIAHILHESQVSFSRIYRPYPTRHLPRWAAKLMRAMSRRQLCEAIVPKKLVKRLPAALFCANASETEVGFLYRLQAMQERLQRANLKIDWSCM